MIFLLFSIFWVFGAGQDVLGLPIDSSTSTVTVNHPKGFHYSTTVLHPQHLNIPVVVPYVQIHNPLGYHHVSPQIYLLPQLQYAVPALIPSETPQKTETATVEPTKTDVAVPPPISDDEQGKYEVVVPVEPEPNSDDDTIQISAKDDLDEAFSEMEEINEDTDSEIEDA